MDTDRFDALARSLAAAGSRRAALTAVLGGALSLLGLADPDAADAARSGRCRPRCGECQRCKRGKCRKKPHRTKRCRRGRCKPVAAGTPCAGGTCCTGRCVNTLRNETHCGACGVVCPARLSCCGGTCVNQRTDPANCGRCDRVCRAAAPNCQAGVCVV